MKLSKSKTFEDIIYVLACVVSLGTLWILRIVITQAIKMALDD